MAICLTRARSSFPGGADVYNGCLSNSAKLRDYDPDKFLANLIWNTQGEHQSFQFGPSDKQEISKFVCSDPNASIFVVTGTCHRAEKARDSCAGKGLDVGGVCRRPYADPAIHP